MAELLFNCAAMDASISGDGYGSRFFMRHQLAPRSPLGKIFPTIRDNADREHVYYAGWPPLMRVGHVGRIMEGAGNKSVLWLTY